VLNETFDIYVRRIYADSDMCVFSPR